MARIDPLTAPYETDVHEQLTRMMPPGVEPIGLFRTFARNMAMTTAMNGWGGYELGRTLSLSKRQREIVIDRVTARCGCEYEWPRAFCRPRRACRPRTGRTDVRDVRASRTP